MGLTPAGSGVPGFNLLWSGPTKLDQLAVFGWLWSVSGVMTAASIAGAKAGGYARYLQ